MSVKIPSLKRLPFHQDNDQQYLLLFSDFVNFMRTKKEDGDKNIRPDNIKVEFSRKNQLVERNGMQYITFKSLLLYVANHVNDYKICQKVFDELAIILSNKHDKDQPEYTTKVIYQEIAALNIFGSFTKFTVDESAIRTLDHRYKSKFNIEEWSKIVKFEYQFQRKKLTQLSYADELKKKVEFLDLLKKTEALGKHLDVKSANLVNENQKRREACEMLNGETLVLNEIIHTYDGLDESTLHELNTLSPTDVHLAVVECIQPVCTNHSYGIHVFVTVEHCEDLQTFEDIATVIRSSLQKAHGALVAEVIFLEEDTFKSYTCNNCIGSSMHKFHLRDDYFSKTLGSKVKFVSRSLEDYSDILEPSTIHNNTFTQTYCHSCFHSIAEHLHHPLDWKDFDLLTEWNLEVPLEFQVILGSLFLNKESMKRSEDWEKYIFNKVARLYGLLDSGLNILNRNYTGVIQQLNTEELIVNYHSISTLFSITGQSGTTRSLKSATRWLQARADVDKRYFDAFLKKYPLEYTNKDHNQITSCISMRDCHVIFYMDNLVRLTMHADPDPGKNRTSQMCTLPITVKGLPKDSLIVQTWHQIGCTEDEDCRCLEKIDLDKESHALLLNFTPDEEVALFRLDVQTTLGIILCIPEIVSLVKEVRESVQNQDSIVDINPSDDIDIDNLNNTLGSIHLQESDTIDQRDYDDDDDNYDDDDDDDENDDEIDDLLPGLNTSMRSMNLDESMDDDGLTISMSSLHQQHDHDEVDYHLQEFLREAEFDDITPLDISHDETMPSIQRSEFEGNNTRNDDENTNVDVYKTISLKMKKFVVPPLICRHPNPAQGRDDDITNLKEILLDVLVKLGRFPDEECKERILFAPDHKISKNLLMLMKTNPVFLQFLPEFPILHLKKSKITNLFSAYKDAGILHLLKYMKDSDKEGDWTDLLSTNIETAARYIKRLALALHFAFFLKFTSTLKEMEAEEFLEDIQTGDLDKLRGKWYKRHQDFMAKGKANNATFALHADMMRHAGEILGIGIAERVGGHDGYSLLLGCVKSSLPFSFLNGATSYASFCTDLLHEHYSAGIFHQNMKKCLFSTPHKDSTVNFALDTQREMDHQDAIKGFRPRSTIESVIPRMAIVDHFTDVQKARSCFNTSELNITSSKDTEDDDSQGSFLDGHHGKEALNYSVNEKDLKFIIPTSKLILRVNALSMHEDAVPANVYEQNKKPLSAAILDKDSYSSGQFMVIKYACQQKLFNLTQDDIPNLETVEGPACLLQRLKTSKGVTLRRTTIKNKLVSESDKKEIKRVAFVKKQTTIADCLSSEMNACQALVNPDCTKSGLQKSPAIKKALLRLLALCIPTTGTTGIEEYLVNNNIVLFDMKEVPTDLKQKIRYATVEFAGVKFKTTATSGDEYVKHVQNGIIKRLLNPKNFPNAKRIIICEEKYSFTPDDFKAATREKRQKASSGSISHLKLGSEILTDCKMSKSAVIHTDLGKRLISNYLARNIQSLDIRQDLILDIDSELILKTSDSNGQSCKPYTTPLRGYFSSAGFVRHELLDNIQQRKGEAEMSQVDWLKDISEHIQDDEEVVSIVTSSDVDSIVIHLFVISLFWPRQEDGSFKHNVYVMLQKQKTELYCITRILELLEARFSRHNISTLALSLFIGGNDFLPKYHGISHEKWVSTILEMPGALEHLVKFEHQQTTSKPIRGTINEDIYFEIVKKLYCPANLNSSNISFDVARQISIRPPGKQSRHPKLWMPPKTALQNVIQLIDYQIEYLLTTWNHSASLPDFLSKGCLKKDEKGNVHYDFGKDEKVQDTASLLLLNDNQLKSFTKIAEVPRKRGQKAKRMRSAETTPVKPRQRKKKPMMSTPIKMKRGSNEDV